MLTDLRNKVDFFIRNKTRFSRKGFEEKDSEHIERNRLENLYTKDILTKYFSQIPKKSVEVLDIGCKNWFYVKGEHDFFKGFSEEVFLDGVELDAYRLYSNFYTRYEVAKFYTKGLQNTNYIAGNLLDIDKKYDYIVWFLPFVIQEPHEYWGLPKKYFYPETLLVHAYNLLKDKGEMLIINQGEEEAKAQINLLENAKINYKSLGLVESDFYEYNYQRYGYLIKN